MKYTGKYFVMVAMKLRHLQTLAIVVFIVILGLVGWYLFIRKDGSALLTYQNPRYGVEFSYPDNYALSETEATGTQEGTIVTLTEKSIHIPLGGENPTSITIAMFSGTGTTTGNKDPLTQWVKTSSYSNWSVAKQEAPGTTTVSDKIAELYTWDGLYQGTSLALLHEGNIILFSVTYDGEADLKNRQVFSDIMANVRFVTPNATATPNIHKHVE
jgi:hypothetical protein